MTTHGLIYSVWYACHTSIQHVVIFETLQAKINREKKTFAECRQKTRTRNLQSDMNLCVCVSVCMCSYMSINCHEGQVETDKI